MSKLYVVHMDSRRAKFVLEWSLVTQSANYGEHIKLLAREIGMPNGEIDEMDFEFVVLGDSDRLDGDGRIPSDLYQ